MSQSTYHEPLALTIISSISIGIATLAAAWITFDIVVRRGWKSMMAIMIPVYIINALYLWPITLWTYLNYGRPTKPEPGQSVQPHCHHQQPSEKENQHDSEAYQNHESQARPMFATITVAVCHCGAGCVLGDIVGEWLVYGTGATINGQAIWVEYLVDFAFAIALGIFFQYFSIAPMTGDYSAKTLVRAAKADFLSLFFFQIGLFGWMAIFQIAIFHYELPVTTVTYWWMMQIGMFLGHWTGLPINYWLIKTGVKEPCA